MVDIAIVAALLITGLVLLQPRIASSKNWRATVTPLASIIGSGFLVLGPVLQHAYGAYAALAMAALCALAWAFGSAIRFNIKEAEGSLSGAREHGVETAASWALAFAYVISVAYYLNLFGAFAVSLTPVEGPFAGKVVTTAVFSLILAVGWTNGFRMLERMEYFSVAIKLAIIASLLVGLGWFLTLQVAAGKQIYSPVSVGPLEAITLGFGLIVTVQGFETSRYLGRSYDAKTRISSMRLAQLVSALIYLAYIGMLSFAIAAPEGKLSETAIIDMMAVVSPVLPWLLVAAALAAQFSAAVADTGGSGGLFAEVSGGRLSVRQAYALLVALGVALTWSANVFEIIAYASRAFALYYALQCLLAALVAMRKGKPLALTVFNLLLMFVGFAIVIFGQAVEA
ncbi:MAG: hypothetical protein R3D34_13275 [Nitratireductor sp.]